jgi:hypothetical protein
MPSVRTISATAVKVFEDRSERKAVVRSSRMGIRRGRERVVE